MEIINILPYAQEAAFDSRELEHAPICLTDTRVELLEEIENWCKNPKEPIYWLQGMAGTGKSTVARTVARQLHQNKQLAGSFFFSTGHGDVSHAGKFVTTIAAQMALSIPNFG